MHWSRTQIKLLRAQRVVYYLKEAVQEGWLPALQHDMAQMDLCPPGKDMNTNSISPSMGHMLGKGSCSQPAWNSHCNTPSEASKRL